MYNILLLRITEFLQYGLLSTLGIVKSESKMLFTILYLNLYEALNNQI